MPKGFFSSAFYTDKLIDYIETDRKSGKPFLALLSYTAPRWPLHAPEPWLDKYHGRYDQGYDAVRQTRLARMGELGIVPPGTTATTPMAGKLPDWSQLSDEQRKREARGMEVYAGMVDYMDFHIGRLLDYLRRNGELDNTLIVFLSDNGADGNSPVDLPGNREWFAKEFDNRYENIGRKGSYTDYGAQWAQVSATPFPYFKGFTRQGGITAPLIVKYPALIKEGGQVSHAFTHVMDLMPSILDITGISAPGPRFRGRDVQPMQGVSMVPALRGGDLPERVVGWELFGRKALRKGDWKMVWMGPPYGTSAWQLYNLAEDPSESRDQAAAQPTKLAELGRDWQAYAQRNNVLEGEFHIKYGFETCLYEFCFK